MSQNYLDYTPVKPWYKKRLNYEIEIVITSFLAMTCLLFYSLSSLGFTEKAFEFMLVQSGRLSYPVFLLLFTASSLHILLSNRYTRWLVRYKRALGFSFAIIYTFHAIAIVGLFSLTQSVGIDGAELLLSIICYILLIPMIVTSFYSIRKKMSSWLWDAIHGIGMYAFWYFFTQEFIAKAQDKGTLTFLILAISAGLALTVRIIAVTKPAKQAVAG